MTKELWFTAEYENGTFFNNIKVLNSSVYPGEKVNITELGRLVLAKFHSEGNKAPANIKLRVQAFTLDANNVSSVFGKPAVLDFRFQDANYTTINSIKITI